MQQKWKTVAYPSSHVLRITCRHHYSKLSPPQLPTFSRHMVLPSEDTLARESDVTVSTNVTLYAEYKGFFMYVLSAVALAMFAMWLLAPHSVLLSLGVSYYPDKYWAQAIPMYFLMLMFFLYVLVTLYNTEVQTLKLDDLRVFTDEHSVSPNDPVDWLWKAPSGVWDLPIGLVNEVLYGEEQDKVCYGETPEKDLRKASSIGC